MILYLTFLAFFFFNDTATTEIYTLSLHDALPIFASTTISPLAFPVEVSSCRVPFLNAKEKGTDRKSTRLNSSHQIISYAVFCLKKKKSEHTANDTIICSIKYAINTMHV